MKDMLEGYIYAVYVKNNEDLGLYAVAEKISRNNNLVGYAEKCESFNICKTWKDAQKLANFWNDCYKKNGKQKTGK